MDLCLLTLLLLGLFVFTHQALLFCLLSVKSFVARLLCQLGFLTLALQCMFLLDFQCIGLFTLTLGPKSLIEFFTDSLFLLSLTTHLLFRGLGRLSLFLY